MKASPGARSWIAAGVRHELLTRALPALRHDMVAPVSVIRMALLMLKRQVSAPTVDAAACTERVALIDNQIAEVASGIRSLRDWELAAPGDGMTRRALVAECTGLMRAAFDMQGIAIEIDPELAPADEANAADAGEVRWQETASLRYLLLGALGYLHDSDDAVGVITVSPDGTDGLLLRSAPSEASRTGDVDMALHRAPRALAIDAVALQCLADDLGYTLDAERDSVRLRFAPSA
ncbi:MAG: hypothetical protein EOP81_12085 [Variovorax sp.]|nr:MAG: hypothetical protein EOP81_12085 [Variovorax sp.]